MQKNIHHGLREMAWSLKMKFKGKQIPKEKWKDWRWQTKNRLNNNSNLRIFFPNIDKSEINLFKKYISKYHIGLTPYLLNLIEKDEKGTPVKGDPIWEQFKYFDFDQDREATGYDGININWELSNEMPTKILHHKYPDRAILRVTNSCFGYCNYCYLTKRTIDIIATEYKSGKNAWEKSLEYLKKSPQIRDILISGGDPLLFSNKRLKKILEDLKLIKTIKSTRLNTRALTFNPFRFNEELIHLFKEYSLTALEIHIAHPKELTKEVDEVLEKFETIGYRPLILWRSPLLKGINNSINVLERLFFALYKRRIIPYYLFHYAPYALGRSVFATPVKEGVQLLKILRRKLPGISIPRYTLFHSSGKNDIPLEPAGTPDFQYFKNKNGKPSIRFQNWKNEWVTYPDVG